MGEFELKLRFHKPTNTYIIPSGYLDRNVRVNGNLITGPGVRFWNDLVVSGELVLGKGSRVGGQVFAKRQSCVRTAELWAVFRWMRNCKCMMDVCLRERFCAGEM